MSLHSGIRFAAYLLCGIVLCTSGSGCATGERTYTARDLPANLRYRAQKNPQELSLAGLASMPRYGNAIGPGDYLEVAIAAGLDRDTVLPPMRVQVTDNGTIKLPELGQIRVVGMPEDSAGTAVQNELIDRELYVNPLVTVRVLEKQTNTVRVVGGVAKEGIYRLPVDQSDVLTAIAMAGGLAINAGDRVEVRSARRMPDGEYSEYAGGVQPASYQAGIAGGALMMPAVTLSLTSLAQGGMQTDPESLKLGDGAVVMVQRTDPVPITVRGLVNKPGPLDITSKNVRVLDALGQAGGISNQFANKVRIVRQARQGDPINIFVKLTDAKVREESNLLLAPGDIVSVEQTPATLTLDTLRMLRFGVTRLDTFF